MALVKCQLCQVGMPNLSYKIGEYIKHLRLLHASQPDFKVTCGINGCQGVYNNIGTLNNHLYAMHNDGIVEPNMMVVAATTPDKEAVPTSGNETTDHVPTEDSIMYTDQDDIDDHAMEIDTSHENLQRSSALFLLGLKEKHKLTQATVDSMVDSVTTLTHQNINCLRSEVWTLI